MLFACCRQPRILTSALCSGVVLFALTALASSQQPPKELVWTHAFDLACRRLGELDFTKETQKFGVEAFKDTNNGLGLYLSQVGSLAACRGFEDLKPPVATRGPEWITGLDLPARKAGEEKFDNAKVHSMEVFRDPNTDNWIYITEQGYLAVAPVKGKATTAGSKKPKWTHSVDLRVRKGGVKDWQDAAKFGIEVYRDNITGNLVYISETGAIAVTPDTEAKAPAEGKAPAWLHGLDLSCRRHNEPSFTKSTRKFGVEVFLDTNNGNLIFLGETGNLAVTPGPKKLSAPTVGVKEPTWTHGLNLKVRKFGEKEFSEKTAVYGAEVFHDENLGVILYVGESGSIAAVAK
jgi:hypothetical protein